MKNLFLQAVIFLVIVGIVQAQEYTTFSATITPQEKTIKTPETATYELSILNNGRNGQIFEIFSPDIIWDVRTDKPLFVSPKKITTAQLLIRPLNLNPGMYGVPLTIRKVGSTETIKQTIFIELQSQHPPTTTYLPAFKANASMPKQIEPNNEFTLTLNLENLNKRNLSDVNIRIRSNTVNKDYTTTLAPREKKTLTFTTTPDKTIPPQKDVLKINIIKTEKDKVYQYEANPIQYEVLPYDNVAIEKKEWSDFLLEIYTAKITNKGNIPKDTTHAKEMTLLKRLFSKTYPEASTSKGAYNWNVHTDIGEEMTVSITTNYRPAAATAFIIIVMILAYYLLRSPLSIKKTATVISTKEGSISEMKIKLNILNRSKKIIRNINIIDLVPKIAEVEKKFDSTMIAPSQIIHNDKKGTLLKWNIDHLDSKEEHILTYRLHSKLNITGGATLPVAVARFTTTDGKERTTFSNKHKVD